MVLKNGKSTISRILDEVKSPEAGATVLFLGTVRKEPGLAALEYEMYDEMAMERIEQLKITAIRKFGLIGAEIIHRKGKLGVGEYVVAVACSAPHRVEAFRACQWMVAEMKKMVPIWKKRI